MASEPKPPAIPQPSSGLEAGEVIEVKASVFKDRCLSLLDRVHELEVEVIVTKHGAPVARLVPEESRAPSAFGFMRGTVLDHGDIVSPDFASWGDLG